MTVLAVLWHAAGITLAATVLTLTGALALTEARGWMQRRRDVATVRRLGQRIGGRQ